MTNTRSELRGGDAAATSTIAPDAWGAAPRRQRSIRHHGTRQASDRRRLECAGWRTTLEYVENQARGADGQLSHVVAQWRAEGELVNAQGEIRVVAAAGPNPETAWSRVWSAIECGSTSDTFVEPRRA